MESTWYRLLEKCCIKLIISPFLHTLPTLFTLQCDKLTQRDYSWTSGSKCIPYTPSPHHQHHTHSLQHIKLRWQPVRLLTWKIKYFYPPIHTHHNIPNSGGRTVSLLPWMWSSLSRTRSPISLGNATRSFSRKHNWKQPSTLMQHGSNLQ